jgi:hypothetical protein
VRACAQKRVCPAHQRTQVSDVPFDLGPKKSMCKWK